MGYSPMYTHQTDPPAQWTLFDDANNIVNLTNYTLLAILIVDQKNPSNIRVGAVPTVVNAAQGVVNYQWLDTDSAVAGFFNLYVRATNNSTGKVRFFEAPTPWQVIQAG